MSLPKFITWGGSQNYTSGPDNTHPVEVTPGFVAFTPGVSLPAEYLNYVLGSLSRDVAVICSTPLNTWTPPISASTASSGSTTLDGLAWDTVNKCWVVSAHSTGTYSISIDDGITWMNLGALPGQTNAIIPLPSGAGYSFIEGGTNNIQFGDLQGTAPTDTGTHLGVASCTGGTGFSHAASGLAVGFLYDATNTRYRAYTTPDGTTITDVSASLPNGIHNGPVPDAYWSSALGPSNDALVAFGGAVPGTDNSQLTHVTWNGSVLTYTNISTRPGSSAHKSIIAVAYNATLGLWGAMTYDGTNSQLYTSPDLVTWTGQAAPTGLAGGLACIGPYWVTTILVTLAGVSRHRAYASLDGDNFYGLGNQFSSLFSVTTHLAQGDGTVGMWSVQGVAISRRVG